MDRIKQAGGGWPRWWLATLAGIVGGMTLFARKAEGSASSGGERADSRNARRQRAKA